MKKIIEKAVFCGLILFMTIGLISPVNVKGAIGDGHNVTEKFLGNWKAVSGNAGVYGNATLFTVDGQVAWCLQANKGATSGTNYEVNFSDIGITPPQQHDLALIANFGYYTNPTDDNRVKTGNAIWNYLGWTDHYVKTDGSWTTAQQQAWNADIMAKVNAYKQGPSFSGTSITVNVGETITLTDSNGAITNMQVISSDGLNANISGNTLSITGTIAAKDNSIIILKKPVSNESAVNFVVRKGNSQGVGICKTKDPLILNIYVKVNKFGSLELAKQDNKGNYVPNTSFKLSYNADMSNPIGTYKTGSSGKVQVDELLPQKVYIQETAVPGHLILDSTIYSKDIVSNTTTTYNATNNWKQGYIQVVKKDADSGKIVKKAGTTFNVYKSSNNSLVASITTNANGVAKSGLLDYGDYDIQETKSPMGYTINSTKYLVSVRTNLATVEQVVSNNEVRGSISLTKQDNETGDNSQGSASLLEAKYKLYAKSNILDPADGSILISAGSTISEKTVDSNREITWNNLYLGEYYIQESVAPEGYNIDSTKYNVTLSYANQNTAIINKAVTSKEDVIRGDIYLVKYLEDSINKPDLQKPGENIVFKITSKTTGSSFYIKTNKHGHASTQSFYYTDEACTNKIISNSRGALPYDNYTVEEVASSTPPGYKPAEKWDVVISNEKEVLHYIIKNDDITTPVKVVKKDSTTGKVIPVANAEFKLLDENKNPIAMTTYYPETVVHETFKTGEQGYFQFPDHLAFGTYYLEEINAPNGYLKGELLKFQVTTANVGNWQEPLTVEYLDNPAMGKVNVKKLDDTTQEGVGNTVIGIYARDDVITPDGTKRYNKDELVDTVTTNKFGIATSKELFLAKYYAKEIKQAPGYVLSDKEYDFELKYENQDTPLVEIDLEMTNSPTRLKLIKTLLDTDQKLEGIKFKIINKEIDTAINNAVDGLEDDWFFGVIGDIVDEGFNQGTIFETDENGEINIKYLLPGNYTVQEIETLDGLVLDDTVHEFTVDEEGKINGDYIYILNITNAPTKIEFNKVDEDDVQLPDAVFNFIDKETGETVVKNYKTTDKLEIFEGVFISGRTYIAREIETPDGYATSEDIEFTVENTSDVQKIVVENKRTKIEFHKIDEDDVQLPGAVFNFINKETGETVVKNYKTTDKSEIFEGIFISGITYIAREIETPDGYAKSEDIEFTVENTSDVQKVMVVNKLLYTNIQVNKVDIETNKPIISNDFEFTMYANQECTEVLDKVNANTSDGTAIFEKVKYGQTVYIKETKAPLGYALSDEVKEIVLDMNLEGLGDVHSFVYFNSMLPASGERIETSTNDPTSIIAVAMLTLGSLVLIIGLHVSRKKREDKDNEIYK